MAKKTTGKQKMPKEEQEGTVMTPSCSDGRVTISFENLTKIHGWTEDLCRFLDYFTTVDISYSAIWHQRNRYENNILLVSNDDDRHAGPMRARKDFKPTTQTLTDLRPEQGRQNSYIPKNERARQRTVDEALRADLEWHSQNSKTHWSQTSSSSSSHQWWQHEHQDTQWRDQNWWKEWWLQTLSKPHRIFSQISRTDISECRARDGMWRQNTWSHVHFSQCRALLTITRTCVWLKGLRLKLGMCCTFCTLKVIQSQHVSSTTPWCSWPMSFLLFHATSISKKEEQNFTADKTDFCDNCTEPYESVNCQQESRRKRTGETRELKTAEGIGARWCSRLHTRRWSCSAAVWRQWGGWQVD